MNKKTERSILKLLIYAGIIILAIMYSEQLWSGIVFLAQVIQPFVIGGAIAFVLNILMRQIEKIHIGKHKVPRGLSIVLTLVLIAGVLTLIGFIVVPQLGITIRDLGVKIPKFIDKASVKIQELSANNPQVMEWIRNLENMEINWNSILETAIEFVRSGFGNVLTSTVLVAGNIIGGIVNVFIAFVFAIYALLMKEKLIDQYKRILRAYLPENIRVTTEKVLTLLNANFRNFISGQCLEAVILGFMFFIVMTILQFPYALLVGVLIGFTSLIPIVGGFIGCGISAFFILVDSPMKAVWFIVIFLVLQQIEGNLIYPKVVGGSVGLPSIWVLTAVSVGGSLMGVLGMLLFIPIVSTGYTLLRENVNKRNAMPIGKRSEPVCNVVSTTVENTEEKSETVEEKPAQNPEPAAKKNVNSQAGKRSKSKRRR